MDNAYNAPHTILFADIAGSTRLYDRLGDTIARDMVAACIDIMSTAARAYDGDVIKTIGDGVMCRFAISDGAVRAAISMHESIAVDPSMASDNIKLRIGFHQGPIIEESDDLYGDAVNVAARMAAQAKAGQIITSGQTLKTLSPEICAKARIVDQTRVKGKTDVFDIFEIVWGQPGELTMVGTLTNEIVTTASGQGALMTLDLQDQHVRIDHDHPTVKLGRDQSNRLVINHPRVSRLHARVEIRKGKFILVDQSTNGTYVYPADGQMSLLHRDEAVLQGEGYFCLGQSAQPDSPLVVFYHTL